MTSGWNEDVLSELLAQQTGASTLLTRWEGLLRRYFGAIALSVTTLVILVEWVPILFGGLWLDETFTWWQAYRGWRNAFAVVSNSPGVSPLFATVCSFFYFGPGKYMEFWLRLPAFLAMLIAAYYIFRIAEAWFGRNAAWLALVMFVSEKDIINRATEARPYGLALAASLGLMYGLHVWFMRKRVWGWLLFLICSILVPYWHFLFCAFFVAPALYIVCWRLQGRRVPWLHLVGSAVLIAAAWLPLRGQFEALFARANTLSFVEMPNFDTFMEILLPPRFVISAFLALLACQFLFNDSLTVSTERPSNSLLGTQKVWAFIAIFWMFCGPVELFLASKLRGYGMLVERYAIYSLAGMVLFAAQFFARWRAYRAQVVVLCTFAVVSVAGAANHHWHGPSLGSWRDPAHEIS